MRDVPRRAREGEKDKAVDREDGPEKKNERCPKRTAPGDRETRS